MGSISMMISFMGMIVTFLCFIFDIKNIPQEFLDLKIPVLSATLPLLMILLVIVTILGIIAYIRDSKRDHALTSIVISLFLLLVNLNNIIITFQILDKLK